MKTREEILRGREISRLLSQYETVEGRERGFQELVLDILCDIRDLITEDRNMIEITISEAFARLSALFPNDHIRIQVTRESWCEGSQQEVEIKIGDKSYEGKTLNEVFERLEGVASSMTQK